MKIKEWEESETFPRAALGGIIEFSEPEKDPEVQGVVMYLPYTGDADFRWLEEPSGAFLFQTPDGALYYADCDVAGPFLVNVPTHGLFYFERGGAKAFREFFLRLRTPQKIRHVEGWWKRTNTTVWADLFLHTLPWKTWDEFLPNAERFGKRVGKVAAIKHITISGSDSIFSGEYVRVQSSRQKWLFCSGVIATARYPLHTIQTPHLVTVSPLVIRKKLKDQQRAHAT